MRVLERVGSVLTAAVVHFSATGVEGGVLDVEGDADVDVYVDVAVVLGS